MLLFHLSLTRKIYLSFLKKCFVIPIHKLGDKLNCSNYRPISLFLSLSKIFEKRIKTKVMRFLNSNDFFFFF